jgi:hypothetical protein
LIIFAGSYLPLTLILLAQDFDLTFLSHAVCLPIHSHCALPFKHPGLSIGIFLLSLTCFLVTLAALDATSPKLPIVVHEARYVPTDLMNYSLPYVVSFMSLDYQQTGKIIGLLIFLGWMFFITYRSGLIVLNPILIAFGWRLYEVTYSFPASTNQYTARALVSGHLASGERHTHVAVQEILIIKPTKEGVT